MERHSMSVKDLERAELLHDVSQGNLSLKKAMQTGRTFTSIKSTRISKQSSYPPSKTSIIIHETINGTICLYYRDRLIDYKIIAKRDISTLL